MSKIQTFLQNILSARYGKDVRQSIYNAIEEIDKVADTAKDSATAKAEEARKSALSASENADEAKASEEKAKEYKEAVQGSISEVSDAVNNASNFATQAATSASNAQNSASNAAASETKAKTSEMNAKTSETNAATSAASAKTSETNAVGSATNAKTSENNAASSASSAKASETNAANSAQQTQSSATVAVNAAEAAEQFKNEAFSTTPEGYENLVQTVADNTVKIDTVIEKAELNIKNTASGDSIHLTDSADSKAIEFALYGKAKQYTTTGKSLVKHILKTNTISGVTFTVDENDIIDVTGASTAEIDLILFQNFTPDFTGLVKLTGSPSNVCYFYPWDDALNGRPYTDETKTAKAPNQNGSNPEVTFYVEEGHTYAVLIKALTGESFSGLKLKPMLRLAEVEDDTYEPYTGGIPSPSPDYPQEIEVSGESGSVTVKSCEKNYFNAEISSKTENNVVYTVNEDKTIKVNGTASAKSGIGILIYLNKGRYIFNSCPLGGNATTYSTTMQPFNSYGVIEHTYWDFGNGVEVNITEDNTKIYLNLARIAQGYTANNLLFKPMIRRCDENGNPIGDDTYEPYKEISVTISIPNGHPGIPTVSGGNYTDENGQQWICDEIVKYADGSGERIYRIKKVVFDGVNLKFSSSIKYNVNNFFHASSGSLADMKINISYTEVPDVITTHFRRIDAETAVSSEVRNVIWVHPSGNTLYFCFSVDSEITTVDLANAWLQENNVEVYYALAEPIRTPLTAEEIVEIEKLHTFYPVTNISNDSDCGMKVKYLADSKNYVDNQLALQAQAQEAAMINMLLLLPEETQAAMIENDTNNLLTESEE